MILFFDTETTGLVNFKLPPDDPSQPRLVQLAAILSDDCGNEIATLNTIIEPDDFEIPEEASKIHGITTEIAKSKGICITRVIDIFKSFYDMASTIAGHNLVFDKTILKGEFLRNYDSYSLDEAEIEHFCTMRASTGILKLPKKTGGYKWPKLQEVYKFAFGEEFEGAHDAMNDVRATKRVYEWLITQGAIQ